MSPKGRHAYGSGDTEYAEVKQGKFGKYIYIYI